MTFNLDVLADEEARTPWEFVLNGRKWRVPHVADLTLEEQDQTDQGRPDRALGAAMVLDEESGEWVPAAAECAAAVRGLRGSKRGAWLVAWLAHAGMQPGESTASSS